MSTASWSVHSYRRPKAAATAATTAASVAVVSCAEMKQQYKLAILKLQITA